MAPQVLVVDVVQGGKKRDFYAEDLWNIKYLSGFKWQHLTEKMGTLECIFIRQVITTLPAYEKRVRAEKLRNEIAQAKKDNEFFLQKVEQSHQLSGIQKRKV